MSDEPVTMTIDGRAADAAEHFDVINPATEAAVARVPDASQAQLDEAVDAARRAFPGWRATALPERQALVRRLGERIGAETEWLARILTTEQGKPLADARIEIGAAAYWLIEVAGQDVPVEIVTDTPERRIETRHVPLGVVAAIVPWNFPVGLAAWKIAPALVTGNTLVLKPSPFTPLSTLAIGEIARDILPPGIFNVISGGDRLGPWITAHPGIDKVSFTGSTATGRAIMRSAADDLKRITLELGGNDAAIVLEDADVEALAPRLFWAAFANNAQFCLATKRMFVHEAVYDRLAAALIAYAATVVVGDGAAEGTQIGPIQNPAQYRRIVAMLDAARAGGIRFLAGGTVTPGTGYFAPISIADNPPDNAPIVAEEAFGPILPLLKFGSDDEVVARANASIYGLGASVWGRDPARLQAIADRLEAGTVWINTIHELAPHLAFAGHKQSGVGVENGLAGLLAYTNPQTLVVARG
ncbi:aldehyde dehydrogenase family protein [Sphingomonas profundi]|uniref:aldehyde dehydrogenase family protein n=1 Tax=Alterirhizorhabdus profundi TaxID=2681549 RepID=UPI0030CC4EC3